jgi:hypothetical protein
MGAAKRTKPQTEIQMENAPLTDPRVERRVGWSTMKDLADPIERSIAEHRGGVIFWAVTGKHQLGIIL